MSSVETTVIEHPLAWLFLNVLADQFGLPIPAYPSLVLAGAMSSQGITISFASALAVAVPACLLADGFWYWLGRRFGARLLARTGRISPRMGALIANSRNDFLRHGPRLFLVARFVPGASAVSTLLAGHLSMPRLQFALFNAIGAALWSGTAIALGAAFGDTIINAIEGVQISTGMVAGFAAALLVALVLNLGIRRRKAGHGRGRTWLQRPGLYLPKRWAQMSHRKISPNHSSAASDI